MKTTLTYINDHGKPVGVFELTCATNVVGRGPHEALGSSEVVEKIIKREIFKVQKGDTLFIEIPFEMRLARSHFAIYRSVDESGLSAYEVEDLGSHCGLMLNEKYIPVLGASHLAMDES